MRFLTLTAAIFFSTIAASETLSFDHAKLKTDKMKNCNLAKPPLKPGEESNHGILMLISPRISDIPKNYTGCQTVWITPNKKIVKMSVVEFSNGEVTKYTTFKDEAGGILFSCFYSENKLVKATGNCEDELPMNIPTSSKPAGCIDKSKPYSQPNECKYDG